MAAVKLYRMAFDELAASTKSYASGEFVGAGNFQQRPYRWSEMHIEEALEGTSLSLHLFFCFCFL